MKLEDLTPAERRAMASLVRLIVRVDGQLTPEERDRLHEVGDELGEDEFWAILQSKEDTLSFKDCVATVERQEAQELIFEVVMTLGMVGTLEPGEITLVEKLAEGWGIEVQVEAPPDAPEDNDEPDEDESDEDEP